MQVGEAPATFDTTSTQRQRGYQRGPATPICSSCIRRLLDCPTCFSDRLTNTGCCNWQDDSKMYITYKDDSLPKYGRAAVRQPKSYSPDTFEQADSEIKAEQARLSVLSSNPGPRRGAPGARFQLPGMHHFAHQGHVRARTAGQIMIFPRTQIIPQVGGAGSGARAGALSQTATVGKNRPTPSCRHTSTTPLPKEGASLSICHVRYDGLGLLKTI